jgi:hypothetical protein
MTTIANRHRASAQAGLHRPVAAGLPRLLGRRAASRSMHASRSVPTDARPVFAEARPVLADSRRGPGWFDSSWELRQGLEVREGLPADARLHEWIEVCLLEG